MTAAWGLRKRAWASNNLIEEWLEKTEVEAMDDHVNSGEEDSEDDEDAVSFLLGHIPKISPKKQEKSFETVDILEAKSEELKIEADKEEEISTDSSPFEKEQTTELVPEEETMEVSGTHDVANANYMKRKFACATCSKRFLRRSNLIDHLNLHANIRGFVCSVCKKGFTQKGNLMAHIRTHTKEKPYMCPVSECGKSYSQPSSLTIHIRSHTQEKNYICGTAACGKSFTNMTDLKKHTKIHEVSKEFKCKECSKQFTQKVHARGHILRMHPDREVSELLVKQELESIFENVYMYNA